MGVAVVVGLALAVAATYTAGVGPGGEPPDRSGGALLQAVAGGLLLTGLGLVAGWALLRLGRGPGPALAVVLAGGLLAEVGVRVFAWDWEPWLASTNAMALVRPDGVTLEVYEGWGLVASGPVTFVQVGQLRAAAVLTATTAVLACAADLHGRLRNRAVS